MLLTLFANSDVLLTFGEKMGVTATWESDISSKCNQNFDPLVETFGPTRNHDFGNRIFSGEPLNQPP